MRLDKFLSEMKKASRSEAPRLIRAGKVLINGIPATSPSARIDENNDEIIFCGERVLYKKFTYIMLNKPEGYVSATEDTRDKTVLDLLPECERVKNLFPCGRLDKYTLGLVIMTNDGENAHRLLSPKHHVSKTYKFRCESPLSDEDVSLLEGGISLGDFITKPCKISLSQSRDAGEITLTEGKYHQIKRMLNAVSNKITYLERISFGDICLDPSLERGEWRYLNDEEEQFFTNGGKK